MDYWAETMQDDCYLIAADGWKAETTASSRRTRRARRRTRAGPATSIPKSLIVARYFAESRRPSTQLEAELEAVSARSTELEEEHGGEEGRCSPKLDKEVNKANVAARLKEIKGDKDAEDEAAGARTTG